MWFSWLEICKRGIVNNHLTHPLFVLRVIKTILLLIILIQDHLVAAIYGQSSLCSILFHCSFHNWSLLLTDWFRNLCHFCLQKSLLRSIFFKNLELFLASPFVINGTLLHGVKSRCRGIISCLILCKRLCLCNHNRLCKWLYNFSLFKDNIVKQNIALLFFF